jgi:hypothetical protein
MGRRRRLEYPYYLGSGSHVLPVGSTYERGNTPGSYIPNHNRDGGGYMTGWTICPCVIRRQWRTSAGGVT